MDDKYEHIEAKKVNIHFFESSDYPIYKYL